MLDKQFNLSIYLKTSKAHLDLRCFTKISKLQSCQRETLVLIKYALNIMLLPFHSLNFCQYINLNLDIIIILKHIDYFPGIKHVIMLNISLFYFLTVRICCCFLCYFMEN